MFPMILILLCTSSKVMLVVTIGQNNISSTKTPDERLTIREPRFMETSTNIEYIYVTNYDDYHLYKLIHKYDSTQTQILTVNKLLEEYLQKSFEISNQSFPNVIQSCGTTMLAFFHRNASISLKNINALLLARLEAYDNSKYICYISVLREHRRKGLGTKLLNEMIKEAIQSKNTRVSLHVNTENKNALSLYVRCGMRCIGYIPGYYFGDQTYPTQNAFAMTLQIKNVKNSTEVCQFENAVDIPPQEEAFYKLRCPQTFTG